MKRSHLYFLLPAILLFLSDCAKIGSLTGGPKDTKPPVVLKSEPPNYSIHFKGQKIEITFDEFITLDNVNQQLVVSPPLKDRVDVILKNKTILIDLNNELQDSTTYTLNFGESIKDNNEGNILSNYEYVFSTGNFVDSLSIYGRLVDAFNLQPSKDPVSILLYNDLSDSAFLKESPLYVGKTDKEGYFALNNLKSDTFHIFALKDLNSNYRFDLPNEEIAFLDSALDITPEYFTRLHPDTLVVDSLNMEADSLMQSRIDSFQQASARKYEGKILIRLFLFQENNEKQYLTDFSRKDRRVLKFSFNNPVTDSFRIISLDPAHENWYLPEKNALNDSFIFWVTEPSVIDMDTIRLAAIFTGTDSLGRKVSMSDTLNFAYREPAKNRKKTKEEPDSILILKTINNKATQELNLPVVIRTDVPIANTDTSRIELFSKEDSVFTKENYRLQRDSMDIRLVRLYNPWKEKTTYRLLVLPGAITGIYGLTNDTTDVSFITRDEGYYGILHVGIRGVDCPVIVQLMDQKENILEEKFISKDEKVDFNYLKPAQYKIKFIHDYNGNRKWDTGNYLKGIQPEKVEYYDGEINIRSNWELEINEVLEKD